MKILSYFFCLSVLVLSQSITATHTEEKLDEHGLPVKKKRQVKSPLVKRACDSCHRLRVKCSDHQPCTRCERNGRKCTFARQEGMRKAFVNAQRVHNFPIDRGNFTKATSKSKARQKRRKNSRPHEQIEDQLDAPPYTQPQYDPPPSLPAVVVCPTCNQYFSPGVDAYYNNQPGPMPYPMPAQDFGYPNPEAYIPPQAQGGLMPYNQGFSVQCTTYVETTSSTHDFYYLQPNQNNTWQAPQQPTNAPYLHQNDGHFFQ